MRVYPKPNLTNDWKCPVCGTAEEDEVVLVGIAGTEEGNICQARQYHLKCLDLTEVVMQSGHLLVGMTFINRGPEISQK